MEKIELYMHDLRSDIGLAEGSLEGLEERSATSAQAVQRLDDWLLTLRLSLGKLKAALVRAIAPVANLVLPVLNRAINALASFFNRVGKVTAAVFGDAYAAEEMAQAHDKLSASVKGSTKALAAFDTLDRIGSSGGSVQMETPRTETTLSPGLQGAVDKLRALLAPLQRIDLTPLKKALEHLHATLCRFGALLGSELEWVWHNLLVPLMEWTITEAAPAAVELLAQAFTTLSQILQPALHGIKAFLPSLQPLAEFLGQSLVSALNSASALLNTLGDAFTREGGRIYDICSQLGMAVGSLMTALEPVFYRLRSGWENTVQALCAGADTAISRILSALEQFTAFLAGAFAGDLTKAWQAVGGQSDSALRGVLNGGVSLVNALLGAVTDGINAVIRGINRLSFTVPSWVPGFGGKSFGLKLQGVTTPRIPYLAQGAVLPANKPFLAVVGDQKNGTNIEAPLSTIQQALAEVLSRQGAQDIAIRFTGDLAQLGRVLKPVVERETRRTGVSLARGVTL